MQMPVSAKVLVQAAAREGVGFGPSFSPVDIDTAAQQLEKDGYVKVHVGTNSGIEETLSTRQLIALKALQDNDTSSLTPDQQRTRDAVRCISDHNLKFVRYEGQESAIAFFGGGEYRATWRTTLPANLAQVLLENGYPSSSGVWGWQPAIGVEPMDAPDGSVDKMVRHAHMGKSQVWSLASELRFKDENGLT